MCLYLKVEGFFSKNLSGFDLIKNKTNVLVGISKKCSEFIAIFKEILNQYLGILIIWPTTVKATKHAYFFSTNSSKGYFIWETFNSNNQIRLILDRCQSILLDPIITDNHTQPILNICKESIYLITNNSSFPNVNDNRTFNCIKENYPCSSGDSSFSSIGVTFMVGFILALIICLKEYCRRRNQNENEVNLNQDNNGLVYA